jgi:hypothetical protein
MSIYNYIFIGVGFTFLIDLLLSAENVKKHPLLKYINWGLQERIICSLVWPLGMLMFVIAFFRAMFKK